MRSAPARLVLLLITLLATSATAQTSAVNATKYASLRDRLQTNFLVMGTEAGMSMPAHERLPGDYIRWADATIDLGWYIGVLATEHYMRSSGAFDGFDAVMGGVDTTDELALALLAMQRLDEQGDAAFPECGGVPNLNGFFIRDDVGANFYQNFTGMTRTRSDFLDGPTLKEMSQDQVYHVLLGLALVHALVPQDVQARGISLAANALEQAERIVQKMVDDRWLIQNPACDRDVARGHSAVAYSPATALAISWFTNGQNLPDTNMVAQGIWALASDPDNGFYANVDNLHMAMAISAIGEGWGPDMTQGALVALAAEHRWYAYPLANEVLHRKDTWCDFRDDVVGEARAMLDELPTGSFPENPRPAVAPHGFTQSNRFIRGSDSHYVGPAGSEGREYHGLDYMLLHNLNAIAAPELWADDSADCVPPSAGDMGSTAGTDAGLNPTDGGSTSAPDLGPEVDMGTTIEPGPVTTEPVGCACGTTRNSTPSVWFVLLCLVGSIGRRRSSSDA